MIDLRRRDRHLLLRAQEERGNQFFLCGHDEQHWFVAGVPGSDLTSVAGAMEALKPPEVLEAQRRQGIKGKDRQRRKNAAYVRQGEWFFLPAPKLHVDKKEVLLNEPLSRGEGSKPHWAEYLFRKGGEAVYVCDEYPAGPSAGCLPRPVADEASGPDVELAVHGSQPRSIREGGHSVIPTTRRSSCRFGIGS